MDILLLYASDFSISRYGEKRQEFPPLGLLYISAELEKHNHSVEILDLSFIEEGQLPEREVIGISLNTGYIYPYFLSRMEELRQKSKTLVLGGQQASISPERCIRDFDADFLIAGEGEQSFTKLLQCLKKGLFEDIKTIPGINYFKNGQFFFNPENRIVNLDRISLPARHLLPTQNILLNNRFVGESVNAVTMITSRGCPFQCAFCGNRYKKVYFRSAENIETEIKSIKKYYGDSGVVFLDENLLYDANHLLKICKVMKRNKLIWCANARIDSFNKEIVSIMAESGCVEIKYGVESGDEDILKMMKKNISIEQIKEALINTKFLGLRTKIFLMYGFPGDSPQSAFRTISLLEQLREYIDRVNLFSFAPVPNSLVFKKSSDYGIVLSKDLTEYTIYKQLNHWWGNERQYGELIKGYKILQEYIDKNYYEDNISLINSVITEKYQKKKNEYDTRTSISR